MHQRFSDKFLEELVKQLSFSPSIYLTKKSNTSTCFTCGLTKSTNS